jgi:large subunit ribosomal protein L6
LEGNQVTVNGPRGQLTRTFHPNMTIAVQDGTVAVTRGDNSQTNRALHGLTRALIANMVTGVTLGYTKALVINGVGYRADQKGKDLVLVVGFSHPVTVTPPEGIRFSVVPGGQRVVVEGNDKELVGEMAARIRRVRSPEPYKGKGIAYDNEIIRRKAGKAGRAAGGSS